MVCESLWQHAQKTFAIRSKDFGNTPQRLWQYAPKTFGIHPKDFGNTPQRLWEGKCYTMQRLCIYHAAA